MSTYARGEKEPQFLVKKGKDKKEWVKGRADNIQILDYPGAVLVEHGIKVKSY